MSCRYGRCMIFLGELKERGMLEVEASMIYFWQGFTYGFLRRMWKRRAAIIRVLAELIVHECNEVRGGGAMSRVN